MPSETQTECVVRRLQLVTDGDWQHIWMEATSPQPHVTSNADRELSKLASLVRDLALADETGRAIQACRDREPPMRDPSRVEEVRALFPKAADHQLPHWELDDDDRWTNEQIDALVATIAKQIRKPKRRRTQGILGGRPEHWAVLRHVEGGLQRAARLIALLGLGLVPSAVVNAHAVCELITTQKTNGPGLRPLIMGSVCRRLAMAGICRLLKLPIIDGAGPDQLATAADGCTKAYHAELTLCRQDTSRGVVHRDITSAHQHLNRQYAQSQLSMRCPELMQPFHA